MTRMTFGEDDPVMCGGQCKLVGAVTDAIAREEELGKDREVGWTGGEHRSQALDVGSDIARSRGQLRQQDPHQ